MNSLCVVKSTVKKIIRGLQRAAASWQRLMCCNNAVDARQNISQTNSNPRTVSHRVQFRGAWMSPEEYGRSRSIDSHEALLPNTLGTIVSLYVHNDVIPAKLVSSIKHHAAMYTDINGPWYQVAWIPNENYSKIQPASSPLLASLFQASIWAMVSPAWQLYAEFAGWHSI